MAASDPTPYVATPTGTLQGVAAFSWDGSAWQPTGRAGPDVATPTGVLQGVAPFSWSGSAWTPAGVARPGVATPTGVLDGVAVYTWSGSAWTPTGGTATPSTPSGALRGVAAFSWDGAAWQPASQARPSVPTPYGVLQGVAFFNWGGTTWAAGAAVPAGATLNLSLMSGTLDPLLTFTRASTATYFDSSGTMQTAATNAPRFDYDPVTHAALGLLIEDARTNMVTNSVDMATGWSLSALTTTSAAGTAPDGTAAMTRIAETATTTIHYSNRLYAVTASTTYNASIYAKAAQNRYLQMFVDNGSSDGAHATFDIQAGTITEPLTVHAAGVIGIASIVPVGNGVFRCSMSTTVGPSTGLRLGYCLSQTGAPGFAPSYAGNAANGLLIWGMQLEAGAFPTSYIPTTAGAVTRAIDRCGIAAANMGFYASPGGSWVVEFISPTLGIDQRRILSNPIAGQATQMYLDATNHVDAWDTVSAIGTSNTIVANAVQKCASTWAVGSARLCLAAGPIASVATMTAGFPNIAIAGVNFFNNNGTTENLSGYLRRVTYWTRVLSDAEMLSVTT